MKSKFLRALSITVILIAAILSSCNNRDKKVITDPYEPPVNTSPDSRTDSNVLPGDPHDETNLESDTTGGDTGVEVDSAKHQEHR